MENDISYLGARGSIRSWEPQLSPGDLCRAGAAPSTALRLGASSMLGCIGTGADGASRFWLAEEASQAAGAMKAAGSCCKTSSAASFGGDVCSGAEQGQRLFTGEEEHNGFKSGCFGSNFGLEHLFGVAVGVKPWYLDG